MDLPGLDSQYLYGRMAWAIVAAAVLAAMLPAAWRSSRRVTLGLLLALGVAMALPGEASPAYWLVLAFQWPSGVLLGFCMLTLFAPRPVARASPTMPASIAAVIALAGTILYFDAIGLLSLGVYYWGFGPYGAPVVALAAGAACALLAIAGRARAHALVVLAGLALFSILRLPTGNLWDALLDPLLWGWALVSLGTKGLRRAAQYARGRHRTFLIRRSKVSGNS